MTGFYMIQVFIERYTQRDINRNILVILANEMRVVKITKQILPFFKTNSYLNELLHLLDISSTAPGAKHELTWWDNKGHMKHIRKKWTIVFFPICKDNVNKSSLLLSHITTFQHSIAFLIKKIEFRFWPTASTF